MIGERFFRSFLHHGLYIMHDVIVLREKEI